MGVTIHVGDCLEIMREMDPESVNCCVTSPPYWGLRDYGCAGQLGLEKTPDEYVSKMVEVFREVRRILRNDGTIWLNLGDSYATPNPVGRRDTESGAIRSGRERPNGSTIRNARTDCGLAAKQLVGIPWRVALALQKDGWYLRQDIIWSKTNPMPESVKDRCTKSHEYIFLLTKQSQYYFDIEAIREQSAASSLARQHISRKQSPKHGELNNDEARYANMDSGQYGNGRNRRSVWNISLKPYKGAHFAAFPPDLIKPCILAGCPEGGTVLDQFAGSGTVAEVAQDCNCNSIMIEINPEYIPLIRNRTKNGILF